MNRITLDKDARVIPEWDRYLLTDRQERGLDKLQTPITPGVYEWSILFGRWTLTTLTDYDENDNLQDQVFPSNNVLIFPDLRSPVSPSPIEPPDFSDAFQGGRSGGAGAGAGWTDSPSPLVPPIFSPSDPGSSSPSDGGYNQSLPAESPDPTPSSFESISSAEVAPSYDSGSSSSYDSGSSSSYDSGSSSSFDSGSSSSGGSDNGF